jgi:DNA-binding response OmpR family regulator
MDAMMPGMDGYEVTRRIRQNKKLAFIPILMITAYEDANAAKGLDLGANDFIRKPIDYDELLARVKASLRLKDMMNSP